MPRAVKERHTNTVDDDGVPLSGVRMSNVSQNILDGINFLCGVNIVIILLLFFLLFFFTVNRRQATGSVAT